MKNRKNPNKTLTAKGAKEREGIQSLGQRVRHICWVSHSNSFTSCFSLRASASFAVK